MMLPQPSLATLTRPLTLASELLWHGIEYMCRYQCLLRSCASLLDQFSVCLNGSDSPKYAIDLHLVQLFQGMAVTQPRLECCDLHRLSILPVSFSVTE